MRNFNCFFKPFVLLLVFCITALAQSNKKPLAGYTMLVVEKFTVEKSKATEEFPEGEEEVLQKGAIARLRNKKAFTEIIDGAESSTVTEATNSKRVIVSGTIIEFKKGSRAKRYVVGLGAGATKIKIRFVFRDADSKRELLSVDREGKFSGANTFTGGSGTQAMAGAEDNIIDRLVKEIDKNR